MYDRKHKQKELYILSSTIIKIIKIIIYPLNVIFFYAFLYTYSENLGVYGPIKNILYRDISYLYYLPEI